MVSIFGQRFGNSNSSRQIGAAVGQGAADRVGARVEVMVGIGIAVGLGDCNDSHPNSNTCSLTPTGLPGLIPCIKT